MNMVDCATRIDHQNPHERITHIGGISNNGRFKVTSDQAIQMIDSGKYDFYVNRGGKQVKVITDTRNGRKYLKTEADGYEPNNLLALPNCP